MQQSFGTVVVVVVVVAVVLALVAMSSSARTWSEYGKGMVKDRDSPPEPPPGSRASAREREEDIRALLKARNARRVRRGEQPLDVEDELARLTSRAPPRRSPGPDDAAARSERAEPPPLDAEAGGQDAGGRTGPAVDPSLREEVRQLVIARNHRRARVGKPPLDVEAEVDRQLRRVNDV